MSNQLTIVDAFDDLFRSFGTTMNMPSHFYDLSFPPMNFWVNNSTKDLEFEFAVAGIPRDRIDLSFEGDYMYLKIESSHEDREGFTLVQRGIKKSSQHQKIYVPDSKYDTEKAVATMENGVLKIAIPAKESQRPRRLQIADK